MINKTIIGAIVVHAEKRQELLNRLTPDDFTDGLAKIIFEKFQKRYAEFSEADIAAIINDFPQEEKSYTLLAAQEAPLKTAVDDTINLFLVSSANQRMNKRLSDLSLLGNGTIAAARAIVDEAEREIEKINPKNAAEKYLADFYTPAERIATGFADLDKMLNGGFVKKTICGIGARPSTGKTTFVLNIALNNPDLKTLFFSLEMSTTMLYDRMFANLADIPYPRINQRQDITKQEYELIQELMKLYSNFTILDDTSSIEDIIAEIYKNKPELVIIDFMQIITSKSKFADNRLRIDYISQMLKFTAKRCNCVIVVLSQLTRAAKDAPTMSALKESGGLEQDCDYVMLLHRPYVNDKANKENDPRNTQLILDKNKFGDNGIINYDFNGAKQRFTELGKEEEEYTRPINVKTNEEAIEDLEF